MNCEVLERRLQDFLDGKLPVAERLEIEAHLADCPACAELARLMEMGPPEEGVPDLTGAVLERTSGAACDRAREILCDAADGIADPIDADLLRIHLDGCTHCAALAVALEHLLQDLPAMAELEPTGGFLEEVLAATLPRRSRWSDLAKRCERGWAALLARPRIAWEVGYIGAVAVWLVAGVAGAPLQAAPDLSAVKAPARLVDDVAIRVTSLGRQAWNATGGRGQEAWDDLHSDISRRYRRSEGALDALRRDGERLRQAALAFDLEESGRAWKALTSDARSAWERFAKASRAADAAPK